MQLGRNVSITTVHVFKDLKTSLLSKSSCIHPGLLEKDWLQSRLQTIQSLSLPTENHKRTPVPYARDLISAKSKLLERHKEVFEDKPLKAMQGLPCGVWGPVVQWLVQRFRSERLRVRSRRSATFTPSAHVRRQSLPVWPPTLNNYLYLYYRCA